LLSDVRHGETVDFWQVVTRGQCGPRGCGF
jgi:hypothetical protein